MNQRNESGQFVSRTARNSLAQAKDAHTEAATTAAITSSTKPRPAPGSNNDAVLNTRPNSYKPATPK